MTVSALTMNIADRHSFHDCEAKPTGRDQPDGDGDYINTSPFKFASLVS